MGKVVERASDPDARSNVSPNSEASVGEDENGTSDEGTGNESFGDDPKTVAGDFSPTSKRPLDVLSSLLPRLPTKRPSFVCSFENCSKVFGKPSRLETHIRTHTGERPFACDQPGCGKSYARNQHLIRHRQSHFRSSSPTPSSNSRRTFKKKQLVMTEASKLPVKSSASFDFVCPVSDCGKRLASERSLRDHANLHRSVRLSCTVQGCTAWYSTVKSLKRHEREAHSSTTRPLPEPPVTPSEESDVNDVHGRMLEDDGVKAYACRACEKRFKKHWQLKTHSYEHTGILPFSCKWEGCSRKFLYRCHLRRHVKQRHRVHRCEEPGCQSTFSSSLEARRHQKEKHPKKKTCDVCGKVVHPSYFKAHALTHNEDRTAYKCPMDGCDRVYLKLSSMAYHIKTRHEEGVARLPCTVEGCDETFVHEVTLNRHLWRHENPPSIRKRKKPKARRDFAKGLSGLEEVSTEVANAESSDGDHRYVLNSLNLQSRHVS